METAQRIISKHFLVPKHEIVPKEKEEEFLKILGSEKKQLPRILADDPAAIEIGAAKGDIIRIERQSITAGKTVYFRVVF